jgi:hypothetical protein
MARMEDCRVRVLGERGWGTEMGGDLGEEDTGGNVVVLQVTGVTNTSKEVVIGQELEVCDVDMLFQLV